MFGLTAARTGSETAVLCSERTGWVNDACAAGGPRSEGLVIVDPVEVIHYTGGVEGRGDTAPGGQATKSKPLFLVPP